MLCILFKEAANGSVTKTSTLAETIFANVSQNLYQSLAEYNDFKLEMEECNLIDDGMIDSEK